MQDDQIALDKAAEAIADTFLRLPEADFRWELAFPDLTDDFVERLRQYGNEESFSAGTALYTFGDRRIDMFVISRRRSARASSSSQRRGCALQSLQKGQLHWRVQSPEFSGFSRGGADRAPEYSSSHKAR